MPSRVPLPVLSGHCPIDELPDQLDLSELAGEMERLWMKSVERLDEGRAVEHAATIVLRADGSLKLINEVAGSLFNVLPNFAVAAPNTFLGTFHTHPRIDGLLPMPFSDTDFVSTIQLREKLSLLYSDEIVFALVRTLSTSDDVDVFEIHGEFLSFFGTRTELQPDAVWEANKALAVRYGFGLYMGTTNELFREV